MSRYLPWNERLASIAKAGRRRSLRRVEPTGPVTAIIDGRQVLVASSNDYLGLGSRPCSGSGGAGSSRLISGTHPSHLALEEELGDWLGRPTLVFPSGYHANLAVFSTVCGRGQTVASDAKNHASIIDGLRLSPADRVILPHADPTQIPDNTDLIAVESLFSMDGDFAPLERYPTAPWLAVDEAHAIGCIGPEGRGLAAERDVVPDILIGTFGKAFGGVGAFVTGPPELKELLINAGRSFIYTTASPPAQLEHLRENLREIRAASHLRDRLAKNASTLRQHLQQLGWTVLGEAHILPVLTGPTTMQTAARLLERGVFAPGIRYPTVAKGQERVRITVSAAHNDEHLERIADAFGPATG